ncbi:MAG: DUF819 family protein [Planctomycetota bacterium]|jgi:uncharacterized membrane protein
MFLQQPDEPTPAEPLAEAAGAAADAVEAVAGASAMINEPMPVLAVLLGVLGILFWLNAHPSFNRIFRVIPLLVFAYFVPTLMSNTGLIPVDKDFELYGFVMTWLLPASLLLLTLAVDIKAIFGLGRNAVVLFLTATAAIVVSGPIAFLIGKGLLPEDQWDEAWRGLAALAGSWIGGSANMVAMQKIHDASASVMSVIIVVDVAVASAWMAVLLWFAGRDKQADERIGADRESLDRVREKVAAYEAEVSRPTDLGSLLLICALGIGGSVVANVLGGKLPVLGTFVNHFTWTVLLVSAFGLALSFTPMRRLDGVGASKVGSVFLYLLVTAIGAKAKFSEVLRPENIGYVVIGALWMLFHAIILLALRRFLKAPIFFVAVGSKANIGGAASAPIVASAFHPALAPVGVLLAVGGYVLGTIAALACSYLLRLVA